MYTTKCVLDIGDQKKIVYRWLTFAKLAHVLQDPVSFS